MTRGNRPGRGFAAVGVGVLVAGLAALSGGAAGQPKEPTVGGIPLFADWPKGARPEAAIVLTGQTFGFLQPCGCSRPQKGGLERRAYFINGLKAKGWPVVAADLGDLYPKRDEKSRLGPSGILAPSEQAMTAYVTTMNALREMGYVAVGVGKTDFEGGLYQLIQAYSLQKQQPPYLLAGNIFGKAGKEGDPTIKREDLFRPQPPATKTLVGLAEVANVGTVPVGFVGVVGKEVADVARKADPLFDFERLEDVIPRALDELAKNPAKPQLNVLLYQGDLDSAKTLAEDFPQFQVILCRIDESDPPAFPLYVAGKKHPPGRKTMIVQVGWKGLYVGVVGVFRKPDGSLELKYQLAPMGEEYITPKDPAAEKANPVLPLLEDYAATVKNRKFLEKVPQQPHPAQIHLPAQNLTYIGSEACMNCHPAEYTKWKDTKHSHALDALEKVATRPGLRQFDAECLVCHTVGLGYKTGFETAEKTPALKHNGCESCHGPGSGHRAAPRNAQLLALMSPWKANPPDLLPDRATMDKLAKLKPGESLTPPLPPAQQRTFNTVSAFCMKCHDGENDPHFKLEVYWPKIEHTGVANGGAPKK